MDDTVNVLILCQRKQAGDTNPTDAEEVAITVKGIKDYMELQIPERPKRYTFMSGGIEKSRITLVDIPESVSMKKSSMRSWVDRNIGVYDVIILNTCHLPSMSPLDFYGMNRVLENRGRLYITNFSRSFVEKGSVVDTISFLEKKESSLKTHNPHLIPTLHQLFHFEEYPYLTKIDNPSSDLWIPIIKWACRKPYENLRAVIDYQPYDLQLLWKKSSRVRL